MSSAMQKAGERRLCLPDLRISDEPKRRFTERDCLLHAKSDATKYVELQKASMPEDCETGCRTSFQV